MATKKQTAANRRNARKSTGPKTPEGKAASSMNNLRHGLRARTVVLKDEKPEEFDKILTELQDQFQPQNPGERYLVDQAAIAQWKLARAEASERRSCQEDPSIEACIAVFSKMTLVTGRLERAYIKAYKELERINAARDKQRDKQEEASEKSEKSQKPQDPINRRDRTVSLLSNFTGWTPKPARGPSPPGRRMPQPCMIPP